MTPLNNNARFTNKTGNNSSNCTFINTQENLNGTRNLTQKDIQTPSHFVNEEILETLLTTIQKKTFLPFTQQLQHHKLKIPHSHKQPYNQQ